MNDVRAVWYRRLALATGDKADVDLLSVSTRPIAVAVTSLRDQG